LEKVHASGLTESAFHGLFDDGVSIMKWLGPSRPVAASVDSGASERNDESRRSGTAERVVGKSFIEAAEATSFDSLRVRERASEG
jgi:hypothetical protein